MLKTNYSIKLLENLTLTTIIVIVKNDKIDNLNNITNKID